VGQKVHPYGFRLGYNRGWHSNWIAKRDYSDLLHEDLKLKKELKQRFAGAGVSHIDIERAANRLKIIIHTSRPGIIIGRKGAEIDKLKQEIKGRTGREVFAVAGGTDSPAAREAHSIPAGDAPGRGERSKVRGAGDQGAGFGPAERC
jgi:ribosomal protein S3